MRILYFFFRLLLLAAAVGAFIYFLGGNIWLQIGTYPFRQDIEQLTIYNRQLAAYTQMCQNSPESSAYSTPLGFELRFLDERKYVIEVVCKLIEGSPIEIKSGSLPLFISKLPGSAGFFFPLDERETVISAVRLFSFNKELGVALEGDTVKTGNDIQPILGNFPRAACVSFGYACCEEGSQSGQGEMLTRAVTDCPTRCFPSCASVPFVELFNSDPPYEPQSREIVMTESQMAVVFNYGISPKTISSVHIDFGDGSGEDSTYADGIFTHTFSCPGPCRYSAKLSARDSKGVSSIETNESKIYIIRR